MRKRMIVTVEVEAASFPDKDIIATALSGVLRNEEGDPFQWGDATVYDGVQDLLLDAAECFEGLDLPEPFVVPFAMPRENGEDVGVVAGRIEIGPLGVEVFVDGFGMKEAPPGKGSVVYINHLDGSPQVIIHGDINQESPSHRINLNTATEGIRGWTNSPLPTYGVERGLGLRPTITHEFNRPKPLDIDDLMRYLDDHVIHHGVVTAATNRIGKDADIQMVAHVAYELANERADDYHSAGTCVATWMAENKLNND